MGTTLARTKAVVASACQMFRRTERIVELSPNYPPEAAIQRRRYGYREAEKGRMPTMIEVCRYGGHRRRAEDDYRPEAVMRLG